MATLLQILFILPSIIIFFPTTTAASFSSYQSPSSMPPPPPSDYNFATPLSNLGFRDLSAAAAVSPALNSTAMITVFAPNDSSLRSCPSCNISLLLLEHSIPGLYPAHLLRALAFGTKIETLASTSTSTPLCLTLTKTTTTTTNDNSNDTDITLFVGGVEVTHPDLYNDGRIIVHGIQGFLSHLSPLSCQIERLTSLSFPTQPFSPSSFLTMRLLLKDALLRLRISGYSAVSLAMQEKYDQLSDLRNMTVFAVNDDAVFGDGHSYVSDLRYHIVPNQLLMAVDLVELPLDTVLPTMEGGENIVVTAAGGGGPMLPMRINNVKIVRTDVVRNNGIAVHEIAGPFQRVHQTGMGFWPDRPSLGPSSTAYMKIVAPRVNCHGGSRT